MADNYPTPPPPRKLYRSRTNRAIAGVCGGLAEYFDVDPTLIRILWVLFSLFYLIGVLGYILLVVFIPEEPETEVYWEPP
ncbi:MAG: PspC domain-containing protein [Candidatus Thorarchaeota archaeon]